MGLFDFFKKKNKSEVIEEEQGVDSTAAVEEAAAEAENNVNDTAEEAATEAAQAVGETESGAAEEELQLAEESAGVEEAPVPQDEPNPVRPEIIPEQQAELKKKREEEEKKREEEGKVLSFLIDRHNDQRSGESLQTCIKALSTSWLWVPMRMQMSKNDAAALQEAQKTGQKYAPKDPVRLVPALIRTKDGELVYSSFTNRDEIPKEMTKQFIWVQVPSGKCAQTVVASPQISSMIINPNSKSLLLKKELLEKLVKPVSKPDEQAAKDLASEPDTTGYTS